MIMEIKNNKHGGARVGAGRKKKEDKDKKPSYRVSFRLNEEENEMLKEVAKEEGMSIGQYVRKCALENINRMLR